MVRDFIVVGHFRQKGPKLLGLTLQLERGNTELFIELCENLHLLKAPETKIKRDRVEPADVLVTIQMDWKYSFHASYPMYAERLEELLKRPDLILSGHVRNAWVDFEVPEVLSARNQMYLPMNVTPLDSPKLREQLALTSVDD